MESPSGRMAVFAGIVTVAYLLGNEGCMVILLSFCYIVFPVVMTVNALYRLMS